MPADLFVKRYVPRLEAEMRAVVQTADLHAAEIFGALHYHLGWVDADFQPAQAQIGKRIRPMLCLMACEACQGDWERALPAAAAIELLHNFSLIHDDIEDRDQIRRGRPALWTLCGKAQGINAGDALFALSQLSLLRLSENAVPPATVVAACQLFNRTCLALTEGQHLDLGFEHRSDVSITEYLAMVERKTAALVACACEMGGLIATDAASTADSGLDTKRQHLREFGRHLGLAFQMQDDILGVWGDPVITGKPTGADVVWRKKTLPILHGLERNAELRTILSPNSLSAADVQRVTRLLEETKSRAYAERMAQKHYGQALRALAKAELHAAAAEALYEMTQELLKRVR